MPSPSLPSIRDSIRHSNVLTNGYSSPLTLHPVSAGATCCCLRDFFGYCFTWACCPLPKATCCDDQTHCCPAELPVCDTSAGRCLKVRAAYSE